MSYNNQIGFMDIQPAIGSLQCFTEEQIASSYIIYGPTGAKYKNLATNTEHDIFKMVTFEGAEEQFYKVDGDPVRFCRMPQAITPPSGSGDCDCTEQEIEPITLWIYRDENPHNPEDIGPYIAEQDFKICYSEANDAQYAFDCEKQIENIKRGLNSIDGLSDTELDCSACQSRIEKRQVKYWVSKNQSNGAFPYKLRRTKVICLQPENPWGDIELTCEQLLQAIKLRYPTAYAMNGLNGLNDCSFKLPTEKKLKFSGLGSLRDAELDNLWKEAIKATVADSQNPNKRNLSAVGFIYNIAQLTGFTQQYFGDFKNYRDYQPSDTRLKAYYDGLREKAQSEIGKIYDGYTISDVEILPTYYGGNGVVITFKVSTECEGYLYGQLYVGSGNSGYQGIYGSNSFNNTDWMKLGYGLNYPFYNPSFFKASPDCDTDSTDRGIGRPIPDGECECREVEMEPVKQYIYVSDNPKNEGDTPITLTRDYKECYIEGTPKTRVYIDCETQIEAIRNGLQLSMSGFLTGLLGDLSDEPDCSVCKSRTTKRQVKGWLSDINTEGSIEFEILRTGIECLQPVNPWGKAELDCEDLSPAIIESVKQFYPDVEIAGGLSGLDCNCCDNDERDRF